MKIIGGILLFFLIMFNCYLFSMTYEANGEVYMLIPKGTYKGVYKMNNTTGGTPQKLFPIQNGYIASKLKVDPTGKVYTFFINKDDDFQRISGNIEVRINYTTGNHDDVFYGAHAFHHCYHSFPSGTAITATNHYGPEDPTNPVNTSVTPAIPTSKPSWYTVPYGWDKDGDGKPDPGAPSCNSNWFLVPNGSIYHSFIRAKGYDSDDSTTTSDNLGVDIEDDTAKRHGSGFKSYYTVHETQYQKQTTYYLYTYDHGSTAMNQVAKTREIRRELELKNGCHDGCISTTSTKSLDESPYKQDIAISTFGTTYFYQKKVDGATYTRFEKNGTAITPSNESIIGNINNADYIAVSSKDSSKDWIYLLNNGVVATWLSDAGVSTGSIHIDQVAVSDQWWQDGGIIFALDSTARQVYVIERNERMTNEADKTVNAYSLGIPAGVDSIGADGYGNLYFCKNTYDPDPVVGTASEISNVINWHNDSGVYLGTGIIYQSIYKTVYKYSYYSRTTSLVGKILFGKNKYYVSVRVNNLVDQSDPSKWQVDPSSLTLVESDNEYPAEITAVNYAAPPQVNGFTPAKIDIDGPYELQGATTLTPVDTNNFKGLKENNFYIFQVENYPVPNIPDYKTNPFGDRAVNTRSGEGPNADGLNDESANHAVDLPSYRVGLGGVTVEVNKKDSGYQKGGFVSTLCYSVADRDGDGLSDSPKFRWILKQVYNRYGEQKNQTILDTGWCDTPVLGVILDGGVYDLYVASKYNWFDYNQMSVGQLASQRWSSNVFKTGIWAEAAQPCQDPITGQVDNHCAHYRFNVLLTGETMTAEGIITGIDGPAVQSAGNWVIDEDTKEIWQIQDPATGSDNKISIMMKSEPPTPPGLTNIQRKAWVLPVELKVRVELQDSSGNGIYENTMIKHSSSTAGAASIEDFKFWTGKDDPSTTVFDESEFLNIPSDPLYYKLSVYAHRKYEYDTVVTVKQFDPVTGVTLESQFPMTYQRVVGIYAETKVLVRDLYGSDDAKLEGNPNYVYYVTSGDQLKFNVSNPSLIDNLLPMTTAVYNPSEVTLIFSDDNPCDADLGTAPLGYHNQGSSPTNKNPSFDAFRSADNNDGIPASYSHQQATYLRLTYETFVPGIDDTLANSVGYSNGKKLVYKFNSSSLTYFQFTKKYLENKQNKLGVKVVIPSSQDSSLSPWGNYFSGGGAIDIVPATDADLNNLGISRDKTRSYYKATLKMDQLLTALRWKFDQTFTHSWDDKGPDCNLVGGELPITVVFSDSSGNRRGYTIGHIKVRDNDEPNVFVDVYLPRQNKHFNIPENVKKDTYLLIDSFNGDELYFYTFYNHGDWLPVYLNDPSAPDAKYIDMAGVNSSYPNGFPLENNMRTIPRPMLAIPSGIPEDTRIRISVYPLDNVEIKGCQANMNIVTSSIDFSSSGTLVKYIVFPDPNRTGFVMSGEAIDGATDWGGNSRPNRRKFKYLIGPIVNTSLNVHYMGK